MYKINDQVEAGIYLDDKEFVVTAGNFVQSIHMAAHAIYSVPVITVNLIDVVGIIPQLKLNDGSVLRFSVKASSLNIDRTFRVYSWPRQPAGNGFAYAITGYLDAPKFFIGTTSKTIRGSSSEALKSIASSCGLDYSKDNTATADTMVWTPGNSTYAEFAKEISRYGYVDQNSYMGFGIDSLGTMRYRNLAALPAPKYSVSQVASGSDMLQLMDFKAIASSGMNNMLTGYSHTRVVQSADTQQQYDQLSQVSVDTGVSTPLLNTGVRSAIERGGVSFSPIDFGNVHANYEQARYQNVRISRLNNLSAEFVFGYVTNFEMFDTFTYVSPQQQGQTGYDGKYIVTGKVVYVAGTAYYEKLTAVRMGFS